MAKKKVVRQTILWEGWCNFYKRLGDENGAICQHGSRRSAIEGRGNGGRTVFVHITEIVPAKKPAKGRKGAKKR